MYTTQVYQTSNSIKHYLWVFYTARSTIQNDRNSRKQMFNCMCNVKGYGPSRIGLFVLQNIKGMGSSTSMDVFITLTLTQIPLQLASVRCSYLKHECQYWVEVCHRKMLQGVCVLIRVFLSSQHAFVIKSRVLFTKLHLTVRQRLFWKKLDIKFSENQIE